MYVKTFIHNIIMSHGFGVHRVHRSIAIKRYNNACLYALVHEKSIHAKK